MNELDRLIRPEEAAQILTVNVKTLTNWRHMGKGPKYVKMGKFIRYPSLEIVRWRKLHEVDPAA